MTNTKKTVGNGSAPLFMSFVFSVGGWALLELWFLRIGAGLRAQGMAALFGAWLGYLSVRRPRIGRAGLPPSNIMASHPYRRFDSADAGWAMFFLVLGGVLGALVLLSQTMVLGAAAIGLSLFPWSRVHFCRSHFLLACVTAWTGMLAVTTLGYGSIDPIFLPVACWILWVSAGVSLLARIERMARAERTKVPAAAAS